MEKKRVLATAVCCVVFVSGAVQVFAGERSRSGTYKGRSTSGTFQRDSKRNAGNATSSTAWQNEKGQGSRQSQADWNRKSGTGNYTSQTNIATGKTRAQEGTVTRTRKGNYSQEGTITGYKGKTTQVDRGSQKNEDGSRSVGSDFTNEAGQTLNVDKTIQKTDSGRVVEGTYTTSTGKSGTIGSTKTFSEGQSSTQRSVTDQDGRTWQKDIETSRDGSTITRDVSATNPEGKTRDYTQSATFDANNTGE